MKRMGLLCLVICPCLFGQMCGLTEPIPDNQDPPPRANNGNASDPHSTVARTIAGPGFSMLIPDGFESCTVANPAAQAFKEAYADGQRLIVVSTETPLAGGPYNFASNAIRVQCAHTSDSGDYVLAAARTAAPQRTAESLAGYALLADGNLLCVDVSAGLPLSAEDEEFCLALFRSIDLHDTDGRFLEQKLRANHPKLLGSTGSGLIVLDDLTSWKLTENATPAEAAELSSWAKDSAVHAQIAADHHELMIIGRWIAVPARSLGIATQTSIADYEPASRRLSFANGQTLYLPLNSKMPKNWSLGDPVLIVRDQSTGWIIWSNAWHWIQM